MLSPDLRAMGEGGTPLIHCARVAPGVYFKLESVNPSGSYKDRFVAAEVARIAGEGRKVCIATSSGNTGASLAAYCARSGLRCLIVVNADAPAGKLLQLRAHGAALVRIPRFVSDPAVTEQVFARLHAFTSRSSAALVVSAFRHCPVGMQGVKAIASEIAVDLPDAAHVFVPVGGGGLFSAVSEQMQAIAPETKVHAVQPAGCPTLWNAYRDGADEIAPVRSTTSISGLSVPFDIDAGLALRLVRRGGGRVFAVQDEEVFASQRDMFRHEGICSEPAGAAALAGYRQALAQGLIARGEKSVCLVTGHGLKDTASMESAAAGAPDITVEAAELTAALEEFVR